jgi:site-specific DNA recombinase
MIDILHAVVKVKPILLAVVPSLSPGAIFLNHRSVISMKLKAVGYRRVSTEEQAMSGHSLAAQKHAIEQFARQRGWELLTVYTDAGISGRSDQRPALNQLLEAAALSRFDVVVVHSIDRFYRSLTGLLGAIEQLRSNNVSFVSINENLDFTTTWGKLTLAVLGTLAEIYIDKLSSETQKGKKERARKGLHNGSIPFGYCNGRCSNCTDPNGPGYCPWVGKPDRAGDDRLIAHPIESIGVRRAFRYSVTGNFTDRKIAELLNESSVRYAGKNYQLRPKRRPGDVARFGKAVFQKDTVREMLLRVFYTGVVPYFGVNQRGQKRKRSDAVALYPGQHPPLIVQKLFDQAQVVRRLRRTAPHPPGSAERYRFYPLSGILTCAHCNKPMRSSGNAAGQRYYRCPTRIQRIGQCDQPTLIADAVEEEVAGLLMQLTLVPDWTACLHTELTAANDKPEELAKVRLRMERARELYLTGDLTREEYGHEQSIYRSKLVDLTEINSADTISVGHIVSHFGNLWQMDDPGLKTKLLRSTITAVNIQGHALTDWTPNSALYPILARHLCLVDTRSKCHSGSDGT